MSSAAVSRQSAVQYSVCKDEQSLSIPYCSAAVQFGSLRRQTHIPSDNASPATGRSPRP
jgi:hypothetical protein